jgi:ParB family chromosome partitioning protein
VTAVLAVSDRDRLVELEAVVERGLEMFVAVGLALTEIRDSRLYRDSHPTFEAYLADRWNMSSSHGYRKIDAARVAVLVSPIGDIANEAQARELVPLLDVPDELVAVARDLWAEHGKKLTATKIATKVRRGFTERMAADQRITAPLTSLSNEWYTPAEYIETARALMGAIDLDPASCAHANLTVQAARYFDAAADGLTQPWHGRLWVNPPYGDLCPRFVEKLAAEYECGHVAEAVLLVSAYSTETRWFQPLFARPICFVARRIDFTSPDGRGGSPNHGSAIVYFGTRTRDFVTAFRPFGRVVTEAAA